MMTTQTENEMFSLGDILDYLTSSHTQYDVEIQSMTVMPNGWLIVFHCEGRMGTGLSHAQYDRVAFFERVPGTSEPKCKWDYIC